MFKKRTAFLIQLIALSVLIAPLSSFASAKMKKKVYKDVYKDSVCTQCALNYPHWYVAGNIGMSHLFDKETPNTVRSVDQNGPGWDVGFGYQFDKMLGGEVGYTQYYNSRETSGATVVARTSHFAVHANATGRYGIGHDFNLLGKLGLAYSYAQKIAETNGGAASSGAVSLYYGVGLTYDLTQRVEAIAQWARVAGNDYTGTSDLYSIGLSFAIA